MMESKEFKDLEENLGDFGQFMVVEETVITQGKSLEDSPSLVITWGKLKLKLAEPRTSPKHEYNHRYGENKTNKNEYNNEKISHDDELSKCVHLSGNKNEAVKDNTVKNKEMHSEIHSKNDEHVPIVSITDSNHSIKSTYVNNKNRINRKNFENAKNVDKTFGSNPLRIIDENYITGDEASDEGWTSIPIIKTQSNTNDKQRSVVIKELDDDDDLNIEERSFGDKSPIIDELGEDGEESAEHVIIDSKLVIEELNDLSEHEEMSTNCDIQDESENKASKAKPDFRQTIHLSFQRCLDYNDRSVGEYIPEYLKMYKIQSMTVQDEKKTLISFSAVRGQSKVVLLDKPQKGLNSKSTANGEVCPHSDSSEQEYEELSTKTNEDASCCIRETTPDLEHTTNRQEIYLFIFLVFFIFILIFHFSTSSSSNQEYSCYGRNSDEDTSSCALDGYVELSRI